MRLLKLFFIQALLIGTINGTPTHYTAEISTNSTVEKRQDPSWLALLPGFFLQIALDETGGELAASIINTFSQELQGFNGLPFVWIPQSIFLHLLTNI